MGGMPVPVSFGHRTVEAEGVLARTLGLCDYSALYRVAIKGPGAASFLRERGLADALPPDVLHVRTLKSGGLIARTGRAEYFLEDMPGDGTRPDLIPEFTESLLYAPPPGVYLAIREDASFLLCGTSAPAVLRQTCSHEFRRPPSDQIGVAGQTSVMVMTRVAGVSTWILDRTIHGHATYQLWVDPTYAPYLWEALLDITRELGGDALGLSALCETAALGCSKE
jgi:glycine cleavage system aminomethyltransferase T